ncbi:hypothetical protein [Priestia aryabhattai]
MGNNMFNEINQVKPCISDERLAEMFLDQVMKDFKKAKISEEIDQS